MPRTSGPVPRLASVHEDIRRELTQQLDRRWHQLWGSFGMSVILMSFGAQLAWHRWDEQWLTALALLAAGSLLWLSHRQSVLHWQASLGRFDDWLSGLDQMLVASGLLASVLVPSGQWWWPMPLLAGCGWGLLRLANNAQAHWAHWHFLAARRMLRERRRHLS